MRTFIIPGLLLATAAASAAPLRFSSGATQVALIELYTSEGCSSCPPADQWLRALAGKEGLWREFVPVAFHVNYWDRLGWKDRLSSPGFTAREYAYSAAWGSPSVYTPCFVRNGAEWKPLWGGVAPTGASAGVLSVDVGDDGRCHVRYQPAPRAATGDYAVQVALLGSGLSSRVTAGENDGRTLRHEFVVLGLADKALVPDAMGGAAQAYLPAPTALVAGATRRALAAWVVRRGDITPLQATGGWLP